MKKGRKKLTETVSVNLPAKYARLVEWLDKNTTDFSLSNTLIEILDARIFSDDQIPKSISKRIDSSIHREDSDRSVTLTAEVLPQMSVEAKIFFNQGNSIQIRFDGTPDFKFIRPMDLSVWMNSTRLLMEEVKTTAKELPFEKAPSKKVPKKKPR